MSYLKIKMKIKNAIHDFIHEEDGIGTVEMRTWFF